MITDSHYIIGSDHLTCQDYACNNSNIIIVSDGCSSSENTDVGSRILALQTLKYFSCKILNFSTSLDVINIVNSTKTIIENLGLDFSAIDTTLMIALYHNNFFEVMIIGDGHVITKENNIITDYQINYKNSTPYYPIYLIHNGYDDIIKNNSPVCKLTITTMNSDTQKVIESNVVESDNIINKFEFKNNIETLILTSDGIDSFDLNHEKIIFELMNFKIKNKNFLKRRMIKISEQYNHLDDFGCSAFYNN